MEAAVVVDAVVTEAAPPVMEAAVTEAAPPVMEAAVVVEAVVTEAAPPEVEAAVVVEAVVTEAAPPEVEAAITEAATPVMEAAVVVEAVVTEAAPPEVEAVVTEAAVVIDELRTPPSPPPPPAAPAPEGRVLPPMARRRPTRVRSNSDLRDAVADAVARAAAQGPLVPRGPDEEYEETGAEMAQSSALWPESPAETPSSEEATSVLGAPISPATDEQPTFGPPASATTEPEVDPYEEFARLAAEHAIADTAPRVHYGRLPTWKPVAAPPAEEAVAETAEEAAEETAWLAPAEIAAEAVDETAEEAAEETTWLAPAEIAAEAVDETAEEAAEETTWLAPAETVAEVVDETAEEAAEETTWLAPAETVTEVVAETAEEVAEATAWLAPAETVTEVVAETAEEAAWLAPAETLAEVVAETAEEAAEATAWLAPAETVAETTEEAAEATAWLAPAETVAEAVDETAEEAAEETTWLAPAETVAEAVDETAEEAAEETTWLAPAETVAETAEEAAEEAAWLAPAETVAEVVAETAEEAAEATAWLAPAETVAEAVDETAEDAAEETAWLAPAETVAEVVAETAEEAAAEVPAVLEEAPADSEQQDWAPEVSAPEDLAPEISAPFTPEVEPHEPEAPGIEESAWPFGERRSAARQARKPLPAALQEAVAAGAAQELAASQSASGQHTDTTDDQQGGPGSATGTTKSGGKGPGTGKWPGIIRRYGSAIAIVVLFLAAGGAAAGIAAFRGPVAPGLTTAAKDQVAANRDVLTTDDFPPSWRVSPGASAASTYGLGAPLVTHSAVQSWSAGHPACASDVNAVSAAMTPTVGDVTAVAYTQATAKNPLGGLWQIADAVAFHTSAAQVSAEMTGMRAVLGETKAQLCLVQFWSTALQAQFPTGSLVMMTVSPAIVPSLPGKPLAWAMAMSGTAIFGQTALPLSFEITSFAAGRAQVSFVVSSKSANLPNGLDARLLVTLATQAERQNSSTS